MKILMIDDNRDLLLTTLDLFNDHGITVFGAYSFECAVDEIEHNHYDLIISDFDLENDKTAADVIDYLLFYHGIERCPPVIVYSGRPREEIWKSIRQNYPSINYISKPGFGELLDIIKVKEQCLRPC